MEKKILVVDDDESVRLLFEDVFGDSGYAVRSAEDATEALTILGSDVIDVIFLDLKLFGMNGIELCRQIRTMKPISIIYAITGWATLFDIEECREAGFDDYFTKPVKLEVLTKAVEDAFEKLSRWSQRYGGPGEETHKGSPQGR
jgi:CheY-like chemotaxis protein